jgi:hypothetical protein
MTPLDSDALDADILAGRSIQAIKRYRIATGKGLAEAKRYVDTRRAALAAEGRVAARPRTNPAFAVVILAAIAAGLAEVIVRNLAHH